MKLIPLDAVLAKIDKRINTCLNQREEMIIADCEALVGDATARAGELQCLRDSIESLELKEVDLQSEIDRVWDNTSDNFSEDGWKEFEDIAKHFFELGLKVQKGE